MAIDYKGVKHRILGVMNNYTVPLEDEGEAIVPTMDVDIMPGYYSDANNLTFFWNVTSYEGQSLEMQLYFDSAVYISSQEIPEELRIAFYETNLFYCFEGQPLKFNTVL